jgi:spermidine/putrescine transport system ATP-binding protein
MIEKSPAVELKDVVKRFGEFIVVQDTSLQIEQGEFFSLLGPSGCGKTTTLRMIAGFEHPSSGAIRLLGRDIQDQPPHRRNVNMVFQNYALFPHLNVFDNVAFGLEVKRAPREEIRRRVMEALEMVRLPGLERRKPAQLSGGQQQRVALARALVNRPAVLLLDEPLGALDQKLRKEMQLELKRLQREVGITFIYVTHDQEEALTMSDRIAVMYQGAVLQVDPPDVIYEKPATRFVADFIGITNFLEGRLVSLSENLAVVEVEGVGRISANREEGVAISQKVTLAVRPERIRLTDGTNVNGDNQVHGNVEEIIFVGNDTQYYVRLPNGSHLIMREQNQTPLASTQRITPGANITISWSPVSTNMLLE